MNEITLGDRLNRIDRDFALYKRILLWVVATGIAANVFLYLNLIGPQATHDSMMELELIDDWTPPTVCPGERVTLDYTVHIYEAGVFNLDRSLWRVSPPMTLIFSTTQQGVYPAPIEFMARREWLVPLTYLDPVDDRPAALVSGDYEFRWAISTSSRSTTPSILVVPFTVAENCAP